MSRWMEIAWAEVGVREVAGAAANPSIVDYYRRAGHPEVVSDEVPWCAAFVAACLDRAGVSLAAVPRPDRLRARAWLAIGTPIAGPRVGAVVVLSRGADPTAGHVGFVSGWTATHVRVLGGNQGDAVSEAMFPLGQVLGWRWPEAPATAAELAAMGSRTAAATARQTRDVARIGATNAPAPVLPAKPPLPELSGLIEKLGAVKTQAETLQAFVDFAWGKLGWVVGAAAVYWLGRMAWDAWLISEARRQDHNTGANIARARAAPEEVPDAVA